MAIIKTDIGTFIQLAAKMPVLDVRSPAEYRHAHMPGAFSLPLFSDEQRSEIGTAYKQQSREKAIKIGLKAFGPKMVDIVEQAERLCAGKNSPKEIAVHCWRGGMRSGAVAWLLDLYGFRVSLLSGGYKAYRRHVLTVLDEPLELHILGGYTGSNKTRILESMRKSGEKVIDLELLALHKGSAFGNLEMAEQPSQEQFENNLAHAIESLGAGPEPVWVEGESQRLGFVNIPTGFFGNMRNSPLLFLEIPFEERLKLIVKDYGVYDKEKLVNGIIRIKKRLGGLETKNAVNSLLEDDLEGCFRILLSYYDRLYIKSTLGKQGEQRTITYLPSETTDPADNKQKILNHVRNRSS